MKNVTIKSFLLSTVLLTGCAGSPQRANFASPEELRLISSENLCIAYNTHPFLIKSANVRAELERREALTDWEWERIDLKYNQMQDMSELAITCAGKGNRYLFGD